MNIEIDLYMCVYTYISTLFIYTYRDISISIYLYIHIYTYKTHIYVVTERELALFLCWFCFSGGLWRT